LEALPMAELIELILKQQDLIAQLFEEIERLKEVINQDSKTISKPSPSGLWNHLEKAKEQVEGEAKSRRTNWTSGENLVD
jgi:hypothetical protein